MIVIPSPSLTCHVPRGKEAFVVGWKFFAKSVNRKLKVYPSIWRPTQDQLHYQLVGYTEVYEQFDEARVWHYKLKTDDIFKVKGF